MTRAAICAALLAAAGPAAAQRAGYHIVGGMPTDSGGGWPAALEAVGFRPAPPSTARIIVARAGADTGLAAWTARVNDGVYVIVEGRSSLASQFGYRATSESLTVRREVDPRYEGQLILWERPLRLVRTLAPSAARVFSRERWSNAPLLAGHRVGRGGVLWAAASPGRSGFERLPYVAQALADLGLAPPVVGNQLQIFLDYAYRTRADPAYMASYWRRMGIARVFMSAWYYFERDPTRDKYLQSLIEAAHRNGITVYAWLELPHVSQRFWDAHPEWREKNGLGQDALVDWRKLMNLTDPRSFAAASALVTGLLDRFDWDGVTLSELYFEGTRGLGVPSDMTPFNDVVRSEVRARHGFDPLTLFDASSADFHARNPQRLQQFLDYRVDLQRRLHEQWLDVLVGVRRAKGSFGITVCYVDDISEPRMRALIGADVRGLLPTLAAHDAVLLVQDPFVLWALGPERYPRIAGEYESLIPSRRLAVDINIVSRQTLTFPTRHQTGTELFRLVHTGAASFSALSLYAENSILPPDVSLLASASATVDTFAAAADGSLTVESPGGVGVRWTGEARVDGAVWPFTNGGVVWLPAGRHVLSKSAGVPALRVLDFSGTLDALAATPAGLTLRYRADARAIITLARAPVEVRVDGKSSTVPRLSGPAGRTTLLLPAGAHEVEILARR